MNTNPKRILCVMRMVPDRDGHGASQRAWQLLDALRPHGEVHFLLVYRAQDIECASADLSSISSLVASSTKVCIKGWTDSVTTPFGRIVTGLWRKVRAGSQEVPQLDNLEWRWLGKQISLHSPDIIFAGRLPCAHIVQTLIDKKLLSCKTRLADFDDVMSKFRAVQIKKSTSMQWSKKVSARMDLWQIARAERRIANAWDGVSVCNDDDVTSIRRMAPSATVIKIPNVVERDPLSNDRHGDPIHILFAGNLRYPPNIEGLQLFAEISWPAIKTALREVRVIVAGFGPTPDVHRLCKTHGFELHADVPSMTPYFAACDIVIAPILVGSGTRVKILEAMAYRRAVVSTKMGAEGLGVENNKHLLIADSMQFFAAAVVKLANEPALRSRLADNGRAFQQANYTPSAIRTAMSAFIQNGAVIVGE